MPFVLSSNSRALVALFCFTLMGRVSASTTYQLADSYAARSFASDWDYYDAADPTHGFVQYVSSQVAQASLLAGKTTTGNLFLGSNKGASGRQSIRVSSKKSYQYHLMIADIVHAPQGSGPAGSCGLWPAIWELGGPDPWPTAGEIDIYEGVNMQTANQMTLHTNPGCQVANDPTKFTGNMTMTDCNVSDGANGNAGCSVVAQGSQAPESFGVGFNKAGGGVYALEVLPTAINIWHFSRNAIPADISQKSASPDPSKWGKPTAAFTGACDIGQHFKNLNIIINTAFCGDWAGKVWDAPQVGGQPSCAQMTGFSSCDAYVAAHPEAFDDAYWEIKGIDVYMPSRTNGTAGSSVAKRRNVQTQLHAQRSDDCGQSKSESSYGPFVQTSDASKDMEVFSKFVSGIAIALVMFAFLV